VTGCKNFLKVILAKERHPGENRGLEIGHSWRGPARLAGPTSPCRSRQPSAIYTIEDQPHVSLTFYQRNVSFGLIAPGTLDSSASGRLQNVQSPDPGENRGWNLSEPTGSLDSAFRRNDGGRSENGLNVGAAVLSGDVEFPVETADRRSGVSGRTSGSPMVIDPSVKKQR
jgi:hypothetical protein